MREKTLQVLVVEDNAGDVRLLREIFSGEKVDSFEITHLLRMSEAEVHLAKGGVDITLLDMGLPDGQGLDTVRRAHAAAPDVPLIVLTGLDDEALAAEAMTLEQFPGSGALWCPSIAPSRARCTAPSSAALRSPCWQSAFEVHPRWVGPLRFNCLDCRFNAARPAQTDHHLCELKLRCHQPGEIWEPVLLQAVIQRQSTERRPFLLGI